MGTTSVEPGDVAYVVASVAVRDGEIAADDGFCGRVVKEAVANRDDTVRVDFNLVKATEPYKLLIGGVQEAPRTGLEAAAKGTLVHITTATNALTLTSSGATQVLGRISSLQGERGTPTGKVRINLDQKV